MSCRERERSKEGGHIKVKEVCNVHEDYNDWKIKLENFLPLISQLVRYGCKKVTLKINYLLNEPHRNEWEGRRGFVRISAKETIVNFPEKFEK